MSEHDHGDGHDDLPVAARVRRLEERLIAAGLASDEEIDAFLGTLYASAAPVNGARMAARAWTDPAYRELLLSDGNAAAAESGFGPLSYQLRVVENTRVSHNVIVCTLCSCYPWAVLGLPPVWYKSAPYRSRVVIDPRGVLQEFGLKLADDVEVRVWDSTAEVRYLVLPERPAGSDGMNEDELASLVTRDAMVGVANVAPPQKGGKG